SAPTKSPRCANAAPFSHRRQARPVTRCCAGPAGRGVFTVATGPPAGDPNPQPLNTTSRQRVPSVADEAPSASTHARAGTATKDISGPTSSPPALPAGSQGPEIRLKPSLTLRG